MIQAQKLSTNHASPGGEAKDATIFGIPVGRLGLLSCMVLGVATGLLAFVIALFFAIVGVTIYDAASGTSMANLTITYRDIAAPAGVLVMLVSLVYLFTIWVRHKFAGQD